MARIDLFAFTPPRCPLGHYLREDGRIIPGAILGGWHSCSCPTGRAGGSPHGHWYVYCAACLNFGEDTIWYNPPCKAKHQDRKAPILGPR